MVVPIKKALRCRRDYTLPTACSVRVGFAVNVVAHIFLHSAVDILFSQGHCTTQSYSANFWPNNSPILALTYRRNGPRLLMTNMTSHRSWEFKPCPLTQIPTIFDPSEINCSLPTFPCPLIKINKLRKLYKKSAASKSTCINSSVMTIHH